VTMLVTGGAGVVGSYVVRDLVERGDRPVIVDVAPGAAWAAWATMGSDSFLITPVSSSIIALSMAFSSSRMLPGHE